MDDSRTFLVAAAVLILAFPGAHAQDEKALVAHSARPPGPAKPWKEVRGFGRVLDLGRPPVVIDEPGLYALQQDWRFPRGIPEVFPDGLVQITADDVTLDLHGFTISAETSEPPPSTLIVISGDNAEIRNGGVDARDIDLAVRSTGIGPWLHHLSITSGDANSIMTFEGDGTTISDSQIVGQFVLTGASNLERNTISSAGGPTVRLTGVGNRVIDNRISLVRSYIGIWIVGNENVVADNIMALEVVHEGFGVDGNYNVLRGNTVLVTAGLGTVLRTSGTGNTLDGNIAPPPDPEGVRPARIGMEFTADGNYYGNNRMAAEVPFALGGTVQTNWGGNVGY